MSWFSSIFKKTVDQKISSQNNTSEGLEAYKNANNLFYAQKQRDEKVLELYDKAISNGITKAYGDRAYCLQFMQYHNDAIADFTNAIAQDLYDANLYYGRSISKNALYQFESGIEDLKMAISLSKVASKQNEVANKRANSQGWRSATALYENDLQSVLDDTKFYSESPHILQSLKDRQEQKRREV